MSRRAARAGALLVLALAGALLALRLRETGDSGPAGRRPPYPYAELIHREARRFGLDPALVAAVIDNESGFDPERRSPDGAVGLMQVMPATAALAAGELGDVDATADGLRDPATNVRVGCWYLARLQRRYGGDLVAALAAYNAGPERVDAWRSLPRWRERSGVDRIPVQETRSYVLLVLREYERYRGR